MFPDYPKLKAQLMLLLNQRMQSIVNGTGMIAGIPRTIISEGTSQDLTREDGSVSETIMSRAEAGIQLKAEDLDTMTPVDILRHVDDAAKQIHDQITKRLIKTLDDTTRETGNVLAVQGDITPQHIIDLVNMLQCGFDSNGKIDCRIVCGTQMLPKVQKAMADIEADSTLRDKFEAVLRKKQEEWRAREANRKLVG